MWGLLLKALETLINKDASQKLMHNCMQLYGYALPTPLHI